MGVFSAIDTSSSGLTAQRLRMDIISQNIANANTTRTENEGPYRRKTVIFQESNNKPFSSHLSDASKKAINSGNNGVKVARIVEDNSSFKKTYNPSHPDADEEGYVLKPNVNPLTEMVNMMSATRAYEANVTSLNASKSMAMKALRIGS